MAVLTMFLLARLTFRGAGTWRRSTRSTRKRPPWEQEYRGHGALVGVCVRGVDD